MRLGDYIVCISITLNLLALVAYAYQGHLQADLNAYTTMFASQYPNGTTFGSLQVMPPTNPAPASQATLIDSSEETALDVEMVRAIDPESNIVVVDANSLSDADLANAETVAGNLSPTPVAISNSFGGSSSGDQSYYSFPNTAVVAAAGDQGYGVAYPAGYDSVVAVGGTSLSENSDGGFSQSVWSGSGGGCTDQPMPKDNSGYDEYDNSGAKQGADTDCGGYRPMNDVSADADPLTGAAVYVPYPNYSPTSPDLNPKVGWTEIGGTSEATPLVAGIIALNGVPAGTGPQTADDFYYAKGNGEVSHITQGENYSKCPYPDLCSADPNGGWSSPTGVGTPNGLPGDPFGQPAAKPTQ